MNKYSSVIIAGGKNKRINMIKPLINLGGKQIIVRINEILKEIFSEIILVIRKDQNDDIPDLGMAMGMHIVEDIYPDIGPISGIYTGLNESINEKVFVIGGDYPFLSKDAEENICLVNLSKILDVMPITVWRLAIQHQRSP